MEPAPFYDDVAGGPAPAQCVWIRAEDGVRLRAAAWPRDGGGDKGTVLLFSGRTEYIEKYTFAAPVLAGRGYACLSVDWRGQGLADRPLGDRNTGHVGHFREYQRDVRALLKLAKALDMPRPYYLIAHSMGGAIGLRALYEGVPVAAACFSAPMWGIHIAPVTKPVARVLAAASKYIGMAHRYAPGTGPVTYVAEAPYEDNVLTTDPDMWALMQRQVTAHPDLALGGPSLQWLHAALSECRSLRLRPAPVTPAVTFLGSNERVVDAGAVVRRMQDWTDGRLERVEGAEHEVIMETPDRRARFFDAACALFAQHG